MIRNRCTRVLLAGVLACSGAGASDHVPQTPDEFRAFIQGRPLNSTQAHFEVRRPYERVVVDLQRLFESCLRVAYERRTVGAEPGNIYRTTIEYHPTIRMAGEGKTVMSLQREYSQQSFGLPPPAGGFYRLLTDIERADATTTRIASYAAGEPGDALETAVKQWAEGTTAMCPTL